MLNTTNFTEIMYVSKKKSISPKLFNLSSHKTSRFP